MEVWRVNLAKWALRTSQSLPQGLNISSIRIFDPIRDPEIPITLIIMIANKASDSVAVAQGQNVGL